MTAAHDITAATLKEIRREVAADSPLFAGRLLPGPSPSGAAGYADLFAAACSGRKLHDGYRFAIEYIFEGYLLHYGTSRLLEPESTFFRLLAGDYMYARGLDRLAALGDLFCIRMLADLISFCSFIHCQELDPGLCLSAWSLATLGVAENAAGEGGHRHDGAGAFESIRDMAWSGGIRQQEMDALVKEALSSCPDDRRQEISAQLASIQAGFAGKVVA